MKPIALGIMVAFLAGCNLVFPTQVSFQNATTSYTFLEIRIGSVDYLSGLAPGQATGFFEISPGSYTVFTRGTNGILYQWPQQQSIVQGYSYTLVFFVNNTSINYSTYISMAH
ncbi:MAG TPA: hypothetical protein VMV03_00600 [Spirochaetia bacterium]|nr:hypothetical protein [Spirochaetia bacterium]